MRQRDSQSTSRPEQETARIRDEAIRRALRTPPTTLEELKKKRKPKTSAPSAKR
jgi:hypothetical protein